MPSSNYYQVIVSTPGPQGPPGTSASGVAASVNFAFSSGTATYANSAASARSASTTSQTNFSALSISGSSVATQAYVNASIQTHNATTTNVHGITDTSIPNRLLWNSSDQRLEFYSGTSGSVLAGITQDQFLMATNRTLATTMTKGQVVKLDGSQGSRAVVSLASASTEFDSSATIGFVAESIGYNANGLIQTSGYIENINTAHLVEGNLVWLSTTSGSTTSTIPTAPYHRVILGVCVVSHATVGKIFIRPIVGYEIEELHNVLITSVANNDILKYDSSASVWKNTPISSASVGFATNSSSATYATNAGSANFANTSASLNGLAASAYAQLASANFTNAASVSGSIIATQSWVQSQGYGAGGSSSYSASAGSATYSSNSGSLGGIAAASYARLSGANFVSSACISGSVIATQDYVLAQTGGMSASVAFATRSSSATVSGSADYATNSGTTSQTNFNQLTLISYPVATQAWVLASGSTVYSTNSGSSNYATNAGSANYSINAGSANYATNSGSANFATNSSTATFSVNSGSLGGTLAADYARLSSANFTGASISGSAIATQAYVNNASVAFATRASSATFFTGIATSSVAYASSAAFANNSASTSQTNFSTLTISGSNVATQSWVLYTGSTTYATNAGSANYATNAGSANYAINSGSSNYATNSGSANYATNAGNSTTTSQTSFSNLSTGSINVTSTTQSIDNITGAIVVAGGAGISKNVNIGGDLSVTGAIYTSGSAFTISGSNITIPDPLIYLATGNAANLNDIGIVGHFNDGTYQHTGFVRDHNDAVWKLFSFIQDEPTNTINFGSSAIYDVARVGGLQVNTGSIRYATINGAGSGSFTALNISGSNVATTNYVQSASVAFAASAGNATTTSQTDFTTLTKSGVNVATVNDFATASVSYASTSASALNSASLGNQIAGYYAPLTNPNFNTGASVAGSQIITQSNISTASVTFATSATFFTGVSTASVAYATNAGNSASLGGYPSSSFALLGSPSFTGNVFINGTISANQLAGNLLSTSSGAALGTAAIGTSAIPARSDHVHPSRETIRYSYSGSLTTASDVYRTYNKTGRNQTIKRIWTSVGTPPASSSVIVDVKKGTGAATATTIFTTATKPTIMTGSYVSPAVTNMDITAFNDNDYLAFDITTAGTTSSDLIITVELDG